MNLEQLNEELRNKMDPFGNPLSHVIFFYFNIQYSIVQLFYYSAIQQKGINATSEILLR